MKIQGTTTLVSGASSGIGEASTSDYAKQGAHTVLPRARTEADLNRVVKEITEDGGHALPFPVDLSNAQAETLVAEKITREIDAPDILINNAGGGRWLCVDETSPDEAIQMMAMPHYAACFVTRAFLPQMLRRKSGHIVNVTSVGAYRVIPGGAAYTAARAGQLEVSLRHFQLSGKGPGLGSPYRPREECSRHISR